MYFPMQCVSKRQGVIKAPAFCRYTHTLPYNAVLSALKAFRFSIEMLPITLAAASAEKGGENHRHFLRFSDEQRTLFELGRCMCCTSPRNPSLNSPVGYFTTGSGAGENNGRACFMLRLYSAAYRSGYAISPHFLQRSALRLRSSTPFFPYRKPSARLRAE